MRDMCGPRFWLDYGRFLSLEHPIAAQTSIVTPPPPAGRLSPEESRAPQELEVLREVWVGT